MKKNRHKHSTDKEEEQMMKDIEEPLPKEKPPEEPLQKLSKML
jgi:hypothetical protein